MSAIDVRQFLGIAPKIAKTLIANSQAQQADNVKPWSETLRAFDGLSTPTLLSKPTGDIQTIYRYNNNTDWLCWTEDVNVVPTPVAGDQLEKIYFTGTDKPRVTTKDLYDDGTPGTSIPPASYVLGIPAPVGPPVATVGAAGNITGTVTYVYTFVRKWSDGTADEGPPSPPSAPVTDAAQQNSVTMPNGAITVADYGITHKRLYRSQGGNYFFVSESTIATSPYADNIATASLGSAITTILYLPPPDGMIGLIGLANGVLAGFKDNVVYLSEPYRPWAYPAANQYAMIGKVIAIGGFGTSIAVGTNSRPYIGRGVDPAAYSFRRYPGLYPCVSKRSMKGSEIGVLYASTGGVALANEQGVTLATHDFLTRKEWNRDFVPTVMHAEIFDGRYYAWWHTGQDTNGTKIGKGLVLDRSERGFLVTLSDYVYAAHSIEITDDMWVVKRPTDLRNYVWQFDSDPGSPTQFTWKSKMFLEADITNKGWAQVIAEYGTGLTPAQIAALAAQIAAIRAYNAGIVTTDGPLNGHLVNAVQLNGDSMLLMPPSAGFTGGGVLFQYFADGVLRLTTTVSDDNPFPLPSGFRAERHEFLVSGQVEVVEVTLAESVEELGQA